MEETSGTATHAQAISLDNGELMLPFKNAPRDEVHEREALVL